jgi:class 3 adenylate cyclase
MMMSILFADVVGFSGLGERSILPFVQHVLGGVSSLIEQIRLKDRPVVRNTWGDALYFVFDRIEQVLST